MKLFEAVILGALLLSGTSCAGGKVIVNGASPEDFYCLPNGDFVFTEDFLKRVANIQVQNKGKVIVLNPVNIGN